MPSRAEELALAEGAARAAARARPVDRRGALVVVRGDDLPFDVLEAKLAIPSPPRGAVSRPGLVNRLRAGATFPVAALVAPAGYGKTALLAQWATRDARPFAWLSLDERDDDPLVLLRHVAAALHRLEPLAPPVLDALRDDDDNDDNLWSSVLPRLGSALTALRRPSVVVLDNAHALCGGRAADALAALVEHVPDGSTIVLAARRDPPLPLASLRERGRLLELGADDLALTRRDVDLALRAADVDADADAVGELVRRTEGWPGAVGLAVLAAQADGPDVLLEFAGDDRFVADYLEAEALSSLSPELRRFARRTSVLDRLTGPLCDAVLGRTGSANVLEALEREHLLVVPLDRRRKAYRYHRLVRDLLRHELERDEQPLVPKLQKRAARWLESSGAVEDAIAPAAEAGDLDRAGKLVARVALAAHHEGRASDVDRWLAPFDDAEVLARHPAVAAIGAWVDTLAGRGASAARRADAAVAAADDGPLPDGTPSLEPWLAVMRAALGRDGVDAMRADAESAVPALAPNSPWRPPALLLQGVARTLQDDRRRGEEALREAVEEGRRLHCSHVVAAALAQLAVAASETDDHAATDELALAAADACPTSGDAYATHAVPLAVAARALLRHGKQDHARARLAEARHLASLLGAAALPWLAVQARLELGHAYLTLRELREADAMLAEIDAVRVAAGALGTLDASIDAFRAELEAALPKDEAPTSGLTPAELRLLPLLATHLSFREIGERLFVSRNTVKTQAISVYRKLGVSARSTAVERAVELGLIEQSVPPPRSFTLSG